MVNTGRLIEFVASHRDCGRTGPAAPGNGSDRRSRSPSTDPSGSDPQASRNSDRESIISQNLATSSGVYRSQSIAEALPNSLLSIL